MKKGTIGILHYTLPPVIGGVESVIAAQAGIFIQAGYRLTLFGGQGEPDSLPSGCDLVLIPEMGTAHPTIASLSRRLEKGEMPDGFEEIVDHLGAALEMAFSDLDHLIIHNVLTKHLNLPLTVALVRLIESGAIRHAISWVHDLSWTSPTSRKKVHPGYPWDYLRTAIPGVTPVTVSAERRNSLARLKGYQQDKIHVIYNGVDPRKVLGLSREGWQLIERLDLVDSDLILLMPVRITRAKNIEFALHTLAGLKPLCRRPRLVVTGPPDPHQAGIQSYYRSLQRLRLRLDLVENMRFVYESGPKPGAAYTIPEEMVGDLLRFCDVVFMPSRHEGFGMPVMEAGLAGVPVVAANVPAASELARQETVIMSSGISAEHLAERILDLVEENPLSRFRRRVRQDYTWDSIFKKSIEPLIT